MLLRTAIGIAAAATVGLSAVAGQEPRPAAGDVPITSAVLRIERRATPGFVLHVENLRDAPLDTWVISVGSLSRMSDFSRRDSTFARGEGPVLPREVRAIRLETPSQLPSSGPIVMLAVFEDGWMEGEQEYLEAWQLVRQRRVEDASYWLTVLDGVRGKGDEETRTVLKTAVVRRRQELAERVTAQIRAGLDAFADSYTITNITSLAHDESPRPPEWLATRLANYRDELENQRRLMMRPLFQAPAGPPAGSRATAVAVRLVQEPVTTVVATIENLRDVPIEAYEFATYDSPVPTSRASLRRSDSCVAIDGPGDRIQPREVRSIPLGDRSVTPTGRLTMVLYDDLVFEGSIERRDDLLKSREKEADAYAYWIAALADARTKPPATLREFLALKRRDWIAEHPEGRVSVAQHVFEVTNRTDSRPELLVQSLDAIRARMERVRQALTRHLKR